MPPIPDPDGEAARTGLFIRRATPADADAVSEITDQAYARYLPLLGRKPQPMTADHRAMIVDHQVWLVMEGDRAQAILELIDEPGCTLVYSVAVRPDVQKRGLGRRLLAWAEREASQAGHERIRLYTNARMEDNLRLYARLGYAETGREPYMGSTLVHMAKDLRHDEPRP